MRAVVTSGMALIAATYGLARFGYGLFLPQFADTFSLSPTAAGAISAGSFLSYCVSALMASRLGGQPRAMVVCAGTAASAGSLGVAASPDRLVLALSVILAGAGAGFASPGLVALIQRNVQPARQEIAQTIVNAGTGAGIVAAGALTLLTRGHWRSAWLVTAVAVLLAMTATLRADGTRGRRRDREPLTRPELARAGELGTLTRPVVAAALAGISSAAVWTFGPSAMASARPSGDSYATSAWMLLGACGVLGATAGRIVQTWSLQLAWNVTCVAMATATIALGLAPGTIVLACSAVGVFGAAYIAMSGVLIVWAVRVIPGRASEGTIMLFIALAAGQALGATAFGLLQGFASQGSTFILAGVVGLLALFPARKNQHERSRQARPVAQP